MQPLSDQSVPAHPKQDSAVAGANLYRILGAEVVEHRDHLVDGEPRDVGVESFVEAHDIVAMQAWPVAGCDLAESDVCLHERAAGSAGRHRRPHGPQR